MRTAPVSSLTVDSVQLDERRSWLFVRVENGDGLYGLGEASDSHDDRVTISVLETVIAPTLVGAELRELPARIAALRERLLPRGTRGLHQATAISAVDQACCDLRARAVGLPLVDLLGGALRSRVAAYANLNRGAKSRSPEEYTQLARRALERGFNAVKIAPFLEVTPDTDRMRPPIEAGLKRIAAVQDAVKPRACVMVDCHGRFAVPAAITVGRELARMGVEWLEEPVWPEANPAGLADVARLVDIPVVAGELMYGLPAFAELLRHRSVDIVMLDVKHCGGMIEAIRIAAAAQQSGIEVSLHNPSGPVGTLASVHLAAAVPNFLNLEYPVADAEWRESLIGELEKVEESAFRVHDQPGIGLDWETQLAPRLPVRPR